MINRYQQIDIIIDYIRPQNIVEIGTWNGDRALVMATKALEYRDYIHYWGFDLFEDASPESDQAELNAKPHHSLTEVTEKLEIFSQQNSGYFFDLIQGNTRQTLLNLDDRITQCDLAFIGGGHSLETIKGDYHALKDCATILFNDYYIPDENGKCPDSQKFGCNQLRKSVV